MQGPQTPARLAAVFNAMTDAGLSKSDIAKIAGVHRSQVSRWFTGETRPTYHTAMRLAAGITHDGHRELADEFVIAAGYGGPAALPPEPEPTPLEELLGSAEEAERIRAKIRARKGPQAERYIALIEEALSRPPEGADGSPGHGAQRDRRSG